MNKRAFRSGFINLVQEFEFCLFLRFSIGLWYEIGSKKEIPEGGNALSDLHLNDLPSKLNRVYR
jgi:hypothetical protein